MERHTFTLEFSETPVGIKFGHQLSGTSLVVFSVNPQRIAHRLGVEKGDEVLDINGRKVKDSEASLEFFRSLARGKQFPIRISFLRERLIDLNVKASVEAHMAKKKEAGVKKAEQEAAFNAPPILQAEVSYGGLWFPATVQKVAEQEAAFNAPPTLQAEVSYGGLWFPATVQKVADGYYHATFTYSELAVQHDLVGQNSTIPADRVKLSAVASIQEKLTDIGASSVAAFESLQTGLTEDPVGYLGGLGSSSVNAGVSWASSTLGSWFGSEPSDLEPTQPKQPTQPPRENSPPNQSIYFQDDDDQAAYPVFKPAAKILEDDSDVTDFSASRIDSEGDEDSKLIAQFLAESALLKAQLQAELHKEGFGDL